VAKSFKEGDKVYINPEKLLPLSRFLGEQSSGGGKGKGKFHQPSYAAILVADGTVAQAKERARGAKARERAKAREAARAKARVREAARARARAKATRGQPCVVSG
jgi:hypothetical protein